MSPTRLKYLVLVACAGGMLIFWYGRIDCTNPQYAIWDLHDYRAMAGSVPSLNQDVRQPFVYRILGPYVAGLMPFSTDSNFLVLSTVLALALPILLYIYLSKSFVSPAIAALSTVLFLLNKYLYGFSTWNYFQVNDLFSQIAILALMWTMNARNWILFGLTLSLGSLAKETPLIMIPVAGLFVFQSKSRDPWLPMVLAVVPGIIIFFALRLLLHSSQGNDLIQAFLAYSPKSLSAETWFRLLINSIVPFSLIPLVFFNSTKKYFQTRNHELLFLILVLCSTFFGYNNERLMAPAFVVFYTLFASLVQSEIGNSKATISVMFLAAVIATLHHTYTRFPMPREWTIPLSLSALAGVTLFSIFYRLRQSRITSGGMPA